MARVFIMWSDIHSAGSQQHGGAPGPAALSHVLVGSTNVHKVQIHQQNSILLALVWCARWQEVFVKVPWSQSSGGHFWRVSEAQENFLFAQIWALGSLEKLH